MRRNRFGAGGPFQVNGALGELIISRLLCNYKRSSRPRTSLISSAASGTMRHNIGLGWFVNSDGSMVLANAA